MIIFNSTTSLRPGTHKYKPGLQIYYSFPLERYHIWFSKAIQLSRVGCSL